MSKRERIKNWVWILFTVLFTLYVFWDNFKSPKIDNYNSIPEAPTNKVEGYVWRYDFVLQKWVLFQIDYDRANTEKSDGMSEDDLQRYLEKKVPGYLEDTYWGQEYDVDDEDYEEK